MDGYDTGWTLSTGAPCVKAEVGMDSHNCALKSANSLKCTKIKLRAGGCFGLHVVGNPESAS